ncbi:putative reverse transcriptase domain-containing protein, partial [Tanacetum coccineum]
EQPWSPATTLQKENVAKVYNMGTGERKPYEGSLPKSTRNTNVANTQKGNGAAPKGNVGNAKKRGNAPGNPDANVVMSTFLLNNHYASILFDTGADSSFISTAFSSLIDITPTSLENCYDVELADGKLVRIDTIIRGCTLNFLDHSFNIDLMPVELGSFDVIIGMDWKGLKRQKEAKTIKNRQETGKRQRVKSKSKEFSQKSQPDQPDSVKERNKEVKVPR